MTTHTKQPRAGENPRTTRVRQIILDAAVQLLVNEGAAAVTATRICQDTGVARTTIYRQWPEPAPLLLDTIDKLVAPHSPAEITGNLEADLVAAISNLRARLTRKPFRQVFAALLDHANRDRSFVTAQRRFVEGVLQPIKAILAAGQDREELPRTLDISNALSLLCGPIFHHHVMLRTAIDDHLIVNVVANFLNGADTK